MATILAHIRIKLGHEATFEALCRGLFEISHAKDVGLLRYEYWRSQDQGCYYCLLAFADFRAFIAHQTSDHHESASAPLMSAIEDLRLEWLDPVDGASPLPATRPQALDDRGDERLRRYAELFGVELAPWWAPLSQGTAAA